MYYLKAVHSGQTQKSNTTSAFRCVTLLKFDGNMCKTFVEKELQKWYWETKLRYIRDVNKLLLFYYYFIVFLERWSTSIRS